MKGRAAGIHVCFLTQLFIHHSLEAIAARHDHVVCLHKKNQCSVAKAIFMGIISSTKPHTYLLYHVLGIGIYARTWAIGKQRTYGKYLGGSIQKKW